MDPTLIQTLGQYGPPTLLAGGLLWVLFKLSMAWITSMERMTTAFSNQMAAQTEQMTQQTRTSREMELVLQRLVQNVEHIEERQ